MSRGACRGLEGEENHAKVCRCERCPLRASRAHRLRPIAYCVALACCELAAAANPTGPQVMQGTVQMQGLGTNNLKITNTPGSIIHWQGFSIGAGRSRSSCSSRLRARC